MPSDTSGPDLHDLRIERPAGRGGGSGSSSLVLGVLALAGGLWWFGTSGGATPPARGAAAKGPARPGASGSREAPAARPGQGPAPTSPPVPAPAPSGMSANGYVVAARRAALSADAPGRVVEMRVEEGARVEAGEVVARLYSDELEAAVQAALARLEAARAAADAARAAVTRARTQRATAAAEVQRLEAAATAVERGLEVEREALALARLEASRVEALAARAAAEQRELDRVQSQRAAARARLEAHQARVTEAQAATALARARTREADAAIDAAHAEAARAEAQVRAAEADLAQARARLSKTEVRAPFAGVVVLKDAEVGEVVSPNVSGGSSSRGSLVTLVDPASLEAQIEVPETNLGAVRLGGAVALYLDAAPARAYPGKVSRIWPTADRQKGTVEVRIQFLRRDDLLRQDMGLRAVFAPEPDEATEDRE